MKVQINITTLPNSCYMLTYILLRGLPRMNNISHHYQLRHKSTYTLFITCKKLHTHANLSSIFLEIQDCVCKHAFVFCPNTERTDGTVVLTSQTGLQVQVLTLSTTDIIDGRMKSNTGPLCTMDTAPLKL